ncbi:FdtA/QdtA family cupin domain-containing protein [Flavobacterium sp.]|uniref:sugar 3,4-ketoisomerase n=1 Tax=Flavobacterium sp. TaxID=239 RepID=UPI0026030441|nr:FdtA/QdtA family cupin domain-containing protein [Flavobacterium sp.]
MTEILAIGEFIDIPRIADPRGNLAVVEKDTIPFEIKRVYYLYDVPSGAYRGGHAHIAQKEFLIALSGSFDVLLDNGDKKEKVTLNRPNKGLLIKEGIWRELDNFSSGAICLVVSSDVYSEEDYIREYADFTASKRT